MGHQGALVAARYLDGRVVKGRTSDFLPGRACFHIKTDSEPGGVRVDTGDLKALFFVKTLEGNADHQERKAFQHASGAFSRYWIEFACDGEELAGWSASSVSGKNGFFLTPTDQKSNVARVYVFRLSLRRVLTGADAEAAAREYARRKPDDAAAIRRKRRDDRGPRDTDCLLRSEALDRYLNDEPRSGPPVTDPTPSLRKTGPA